MGVLPLQFEEGESLDSLDLSGRERFDVQGVADGLEPGKKLAARAVSDDGKETRFSVTARLDTPVEVEYYRHGGILPFVLRDLAQR
jgi:aconitate hydratase